MFITATEVTIYSNISASAATIAANSWIDIAEERLSLITNNYWLTDLDIQTQVTFTASSGAVLASINASGQNFTAEGFAANDIINVYNSWRNDGYYQVSSISTSTLSLISGSVVVDELSGASVLISMVQFPQSLKYVLAQMIKYDYDDRKAQAANIQSRSLGPWSETYKTGAAVTFGYPDEIVAALGPYTILRVI